MTALLLEQVWGEGNATWVHPMLGEPLVGEVVGEADSETDGEMDGAVVSEVEGEVEGTVPFPQTQQFCSG